MADNTASIIGNMLDPSRIQSQMTNYRVREEETRTRADFSEAVNQFNQQAQLDKSLGSIAKERMTFHPDAMREPKAFVKYRADVLAQAGNGKTIDSMVSSGLMDQKLGAYFKGQSKVDPKRVSSELIDYTTMLQTKAGKQKDDNDLGELVIQGMDQPSLPDAIAAIKGSKASPSVKVAAIEKLQSTAKSIWPTAAAGSAPPIPSKYQDLLLNAANISDLQGVLAAYDADVVAAGGTPDPKVRQAIIDKALANTNRTDKEIKKQNENQIQEQAVKSLADTILEEFGADATDAEIRAWLKTKDGQEFMKTSKFKTVGETLAAYNIQRKKDISEGTTAKQIGVKSGLMITQLAIRGVDTKGLTFSNTNPNVAKITGAGFQSSGIFEARKEIPGVVDRGIAVTRQGPTVFMRLDSGPQLGATMSEPGARLNRYAMTQDPETKAMVNTKLLTPAQYQGLATEHVQALANEGKDGWDRPVRKVRSLYRGLDRLIAGSDGGKDPNTRMGQLLVELRASRGFLDEALTSRNATGMVMPESVIAFGPAPVAPRKPNAVLLAGEGLAKYSDILDKYIIIKRNAYSGNTQ
jgi:hypothetical protein